MMPDARRVPACSPPSPAPVARSRPVGDLPRHLARLTAVASYTGIARAAGVGSTVVKTIASGTRTRCTPATWDALRRVTPVSTAAHTRRVAPHSRAKRLDIASVAELAGAGLTAQEIADRYGVRRGTVYVHCRRAGRPDLIDRLKALAARRAARTWR